ncbi:enoyl-CoA hydratase/isomerase family protein [Halorubellus sp. JP-L1]|uniref:enoyl-CoA hydratase/isomerase family protein n=1 Tax=Halorubellus sp. JP-L1 TaxID=2715753 RepID=UPI00140BC294|nr:enoyl-CoA hydratase/isomerase family protein [Halorubellus sp. JP-L1]
MIRVEREGAVCVVSIDRPARRNALRPADLDALAAAVREASAPVVLLRGEGTAFCAGADLDVVSGLDRDGARDLAARGQRVVRAFEAADAVIVAGVDGAARGGGVEIALGCDLRVATPDASFAEPGVSLGLFGAWGGTARLARVCGESDAMDLALSGRRVDAETALRMGLVSRIVDDPRAVADEIAAHPPDALAALKRRMRDRDDVPTQEAREVEAFADLVAAHAEDIAASRRED